MNIVAGIILIVVLALEGNGIIEAALIQDGKLVLAYSLSMFLTLCFGIVLSKGD